MLKHNEINYLTKPGLKKIAADHWKNFLPNLWKEAKAEGTLEELLNSAVERTYEAMQKEIQFGLEKLNLNQQLAEMRAWEILREDWILIPPKDEEDDEDYDNIEYNEEEVDEEEQRDEEKSTINNSKELLAELRKKSGTSPEESQRG